MKDATLKKMLLFIALASAIMVAMPYTISLFGGQHTWVKVNEIDCSKCHPEDISTALSSSVSSRHPNLAEGNETSATNLTGYTNASNGSMLLSISNQVK